MKKKGFTLIELLAVIVILAIVALIATPLVLKYIEFSKEKSAKLSAQTYVEAVEKEYVSKLTHNEKMPNKEYTIKELDELGVKVKGDKPKGDSDTVTLQNGNVTGYTLTINGYIITYENGNTTVESEKDSDSDSKKINALDYTVTFNIDGKPYEIVSVTAGNTVKEPDKPKVENVFFNYWLDDKNNIVSFPYKPTNDIEFNAQLTNLRREIEIYDDGLILGNFRVGGYGVYETITMTKVNDGIALVGKYSVNNLNRLILVGTTKESCQYTLDRYASSYVGEGSFDYRDTTFYYYYHKVSSTINYLIENGYQLGNYDNESVAEDLAKKVVDYYYGL